MTKKKYAGVDKEFISEEAAHQLQQQSVSSSGYVGDPQPVSSSPATQPKHAAPDSYVHGQSIVVCMACTCSCNLIFSAYNCVIKSQSFSTYFQFHPKDD